MNVGVPNGCCSAISHGRSRVRIGIAFDTDEGDTVGTGNSTKTHFRQPSEDVAGGRSAPGRPGCRQLPAFSRYGILIRHRWDGVPAWSPWTPAGSGPCARWSMLAIALTATLCANVFINGVAFLIPTLHADRGLDLAEAGLMSSLPSFGMVVTLIAWGYLVDRFGERIVLAIGSALTAAAAFAAASVHSLVAVGAFLVARRHGGRQQQLRQRPAGGRLVSARPARPGDGHPPDRAAPRSRRGRVGDSATGRGPRRRRRAALPRDRVRVWRR